MPQKVGVLRHSKRKSVKIEQFFKGAFYVPGEV